MSTKTNEHVRQYLNYYLALNTAPEFAVLLRGNWGSGKSWFIKDYLNQYTESDYLYVSLYGMTSFTEIEDAFFQQLHPILSSKGMKIAGKVLKGFAKATIKVDWDGDGKENASFSPTIPNFGVPDFLKKSDSRYLIFDDLERSGILIQNILGYINQFVEMGGLKVILLANEEEIIKTDSFNGKDDDTKKYLNIKEKLIGKSFDVETDFPAALDDFITKVAIEKCRELLKNEKSLLSDLFRTAGYNNLRHLRQSIMDFDRFYSFLVNNATEEYPLMIHLIKLFFSISFEIKKGAIEENEISKLFDFNYLLQEKDADKSHVQIIREKYPIFKEYYHPLTPELLTQLFKKGTLDRVQLQLALDNSSYLNKNSTPKWILLWHFIDLDDSTFNDIYENVISDFNKLGTFNRYELLQVTGILMALREIKLIPLSVNKIIKKAKANFDELKIKGGLILERHEDYPGGNNSHGLAYQSFDKADFKALIEYANNLINESQESNLPQRALDLVDLLKVSVDEFVERIYLNNSTMSIYFDVPILKYIEPDIFINVLIALPNKSKRMVGYYLEKRYQAHYKTELISELTWLQQIESSLEIERERLKGTVSGFIIQTSVLISVRKCIVALLPKATDLHSPVGLDF